MCGIAGIISLENKSVALEKMLATQAHRGPNHAGVYYLKTNNLNVHLGHNRLSIIDLSSDANQPFISGDKQYILTYNGEIYNYIELREELKHKYSFKTNSDTEVLLAAYINWGKEFVHRLKGMFAFAIWDNYNNELFAVRDRFGVKPFHYIKQKKLFAFASEIKSFWAADITAKEKNLNSWISYLSYATYATPETTFWENIFQLPAGHCLIYKNNQLKIYRWYDFEKNVKELDQHLINDVSQSQYILKQKLLESIKLRLRADVKIGFNLSGGIDSTLLFLLIKQFLDPKKTKAFTFYTNNKLYDETDWVAEILKGSSFNWEKVKLTSEEIPSFTAFMDKKQDEPYAGIAALAYAKIFEAARKQNYLVLLDGGGMDEQAAGYDYYTNNNTSLIQGVKSSPVKPECIDPTFINEFAKKQKYPTPFNNTIQNMQYRDLFYTKLPRDLRFNDRMSMAFSTELREPFLDHELVELLFSMPIELKIKNGQKKWILRQIIKEFISGKIIESPKRPIQTPQREWLANELKDWVRDKVNSAIIKNPFLIKKKIEKELEHYFKGNIDNSFYIWQWISLDMI